MRVTPYILAALLLALAACGPQALPLPAPVIPPRQDTLIVPGSRIGPVSLGMTQAQLLQYLGPPSHSMAYHEGGGNYYEWADREISAEVNDAGLVRRVQTASGTCSPTRYATASGLHVGATELEVEALMPKPAWRVTDKQNLNTRYCFPDHTEINVDGPVMSTTAGRVRSIILNACTP